MSTSDVDLSGRVEALALKARRNGINKPGDCAMVLCRSSLSCIRSTSELYMENDVK
jgi:hypothetical protein